jgi:hypothetical protein
MEVDGQRHALAALPPGKTRCPFIGGWVYPRAGLDGCGKPRPTGIRSPDRPARWESLYRLRYSGPDVGVRERKLSKCNPEKLDLKSWTGLIRLRTTFTRWNSLTREAIKIRVA